MAGVEPAAWTLAVGLPVLALHLVSVTLDQGPADLFAEPARRSLRRARPTRAGRRGRPRRRARPSAAAESLAWSTGLILAALLGVAGRPHGPAPGRPSSVLAIALGVGAVGYVARRASSAGSSPSRCSTRLWPRRGVAPARRPAR